MSDGQRLRAVAAAAQPKETALDGDLVYLYCVIEPGTRAYERAVGGEVPGLVAERPLSVVEADGLAAVVSRVPASQFLDEPLAELLADLPRLTPLAVRHQSIISLLREAAPAIVPISFGAVYRNEESVARMLRQGAGRFRSLLDAVRGRQEWGLKLFGDAERLREAAMRESADVRRLLDEEACAGPGRAYLLARRREQVVAEAVDRFTASTCAAIAQSLAELSAGVRVDEPALRSGEQTELLLLVAYLVDEEQVDAFLARAAELLDAYQDAGLRFDLSGPWAAYTFVKADRGEEGGA